MRRLIEWILAFGVVCWAGLCSLGVRLAGGDNNEDPWKPA
jgi:hypothetical protein